MKKLLFISFILLNTLSFSQSRWEIYEETSLAGEPDPLITIGEEFVTKSGNVYKVKEILQFHEMHYGPYVLVMRYEDTYYLMIDGIEEPLPCSLKVAASYNDDEYFNNPIQSKIDGTFEGFEPDKLFKLVDGSVWQQKDSRYYYTYKSYPNVVIRKDDKGYLMKVEDIDYEVYVIPLN